MPAQFSSRPSEVKIEANICISGLEYSALSEFIKKFPRSFNFVSNGNREKTLNGFTRINIAFADHQEATLDFRRSDLIPISPFAFLFMEFLRQKYEFAERVLPDDFKSANVRCLTGKSILSFSSLTGEDLFFAARHGYLFPAGLLKFENGIRIIGINYPLNVLNADAPVREKEQFLRDLVNFRLNSGHPEYIRNGIYFLNC